MKLKKTMPAIMVAIVLLGLVTSAQAITLAGDVADANVKDDGGIELASNSTLFSGAFFGGTRSGVYVFALPTLQPGETFGTATLQIALSGFVDGTPDYGIDVFGIGVRSTATVLGTDRGGGTLIQSNYLTPSTAPGTFASTSVTNFFNSQYASGVNAGKFVFFGLRQNPAISGASAGGAARYQTVAADDTFGNFPRVQYIAAVVPEPGTILLLLPVVIGCVARRKSPVG